MITVETRSRTARIYRVTILGSIVNAFLVVLKFVAGILGHSSAMIADAVHSLSDFATDIVVLIFVRISSKPKDEKHDFGHGKYETLATAIVGLVLLVVGIGICYEGCAKIVSAIKGEQLHQPEMIAFWAAIVSIVLKESIFWFTKAVGIKVKSQVVIANAWHHRSDSLSSLGTALGIGGAIFLGDRYRVLDPIAAVVVSIFIIKVAINLTLPAIQDLLEQSLSDNTEAEIISIANSVEGSEDAHNLRTRRIGNDIAVEMDIRVDGNLTLNVAHSIAHDVERRLKDRFGDSSHIIIHVDPVKCDACR